MEHKDIFQSMESFEGWLRGRKDESNLERAGILGDEWRDFGKVLESLIADGYVSAFDLTIEEDAKGVIDEIVKEVGDSFQIYEEENVGDIWIHHIFNPYKYDTRIPPHLMKTFEDYGHNPSTLREKLKEQIVVSPRAFIEGAVPCRWAEQDKPERVYVEKIAQ